MATIRRHGNRWQAQVRRKGCTPQSQSFTSKADAERWARQEEVRADNADLQYPPTDLLKHTLRDILRRYLEQVTPSHRGHAVEAPRIQALMSHRLSSIQLHALTPNQLAAYRDERLKKVQASTLLREFNTLSHVFEIARKEWGYRGLKNPLKDITRPQAPRARDRRLSVEELQGLLKAAKDARNPLIAPVVEFALETGMRRGELLALKWTDVPRSFELAYLPMTKNGHPRTVPLTARASEILKALHAKKDGKCAYVFPLTANALKLAWVRTVKRAGLQDFHFHDMRHEAISRFFELGLSMPEVALISGHRDPRMLFRYTHPRPSVVGQRLRALDHRTTSRQG